MRFVAATNRDLRGGGVEGAFRRDLFFRLNGISLSIPPLRERPTEVPALAASFVVAYCRENSMPAPTISEDVLELLVTYSWPGNIRELKNVMERAVVLCDGNEILPENLPREKMTSEPLGDRPTPSEAGTRIADCLPTSRFSASAWSTRWRSTWGTSDARGGFAGDAAADVGREVGPLRDSAAPEVHLTAGHAGARDIAPSGFSPPARRRPRRHYALRRELSVYAHR